LWNTGLGDLEMAWKQKLGEGATSEFLGEFTEYPERYKAASPICLLPFKIPQVIVHGSADDRVPIEMHKSHSINTTQVLVRISSF
jgi:dipeptidyl aminopeptidase/acylaminoacyl peptidase